jgi:serine phosphatase RsbU (regulator of sigma subunit)
MEKKAQTSKEISQINIQTEKVDKLNEQAYLIRYSNASESIKHAEEALKISEKINYPTGKAIAMMHLAFANFIMSKDYPILQSLVDASNILSDVKKIPELPIVLNYLGNVYDSYGEYQKGIEYCHKALTHAKANGLREVEGDTLSTLGIIFSRLCDFQSSIKYHLQSYAIRTEIDNKPAMASSLNLIARSYTLNDESDKAEEFYNKAIEFRKSIGDSSALPWSYLGLASLYEKQKKYTNAIEYYNLSIGLSKDSNDRRCDLQCNLGLGKIFLETGELEKAIDCLKKSKDTATELNAKPILYEALKALSEYYERVGSIEEAYVYYKQYHALKEDVLNTQLHNKLKNQQISFEVEKVQKEAEIYQLRNVELKQAFDQIAEKNKQILESIHYARNIQSAVILPDSKLQSVLPDHFIINRPRDIVNGDFLFASNINGKLYISVVDCTGHGVPGAFMSILGYSFINEIVQVHPEFKASEILELLRRKTISALRQSNDPDNKNQDGMVLAFCIIDYELNKIQYAGAYNPLYCIKNGELEEVRANRMQIGISVHVDVPFTNQEIELVKGMHLYMCSDGYSDQFGGENSRKFLSANFKKLLLEINTLPMKEQGSILEKTLIDWMGDHEQTDDIMVLGLQL